MIELRCLVCGDFSYCHNTSYHHFISKVTTPEEQKFVDEVWFPNSDPNEEFFRKYFPREIAEEAIAELNAQRGKTA